MKLFRNIRKLLLNEGKTGKYLKYALGEIVLVVIGILIALQINKWNGEIKDKTMEQTILKNLSQEYHKNHEDLDKMIATVSNCYNANLTIMSLFKQDPSYLKTKNIDSLLFFSLEFDRFSPSENVLQELLSSGKLNLISNDNLKNLLFDWTRVLKMADEHYNDCLKKLSDDINPYLTQHYVFKDLDKFGNLKWEEPSKFELEKLAIFDDVVYENLTDDFMYRIDRYLIQLKMLKQIIEEIESQTHDQTL